MGNFSSPTPSTPLNVHSSSFLFSMLITGPGLRGDMLCLYASALTNFSSPPLIIALLPSLTSPSSRLMAFLGFGGNIKVPFPEEHLTGVYRPDTHKHPEEKRNGKTLAGKNMGIRMRRRRAGNKCRGRAREGCLRGFLGEGGQGRCEEGYGVENQNHRLLGDKEEDGPRLGATVMPGKGLGARR